MSKITKKELQRAIQRQETRIDHLVRLLAENGYYISNGDIERWESEVDNEPQLKQLDQSIFDGLDEKWRFAMVSSVGIPFVYDYKPTGMRAFLSDSSAQLMVNLEKVMRIDEYDYDTSNWQNSLIERDIAKELLEVDLSSELTGSDLCVAMLLRLDKYVMCMTDDGVDVIHDLACLVSSTHPFIGRLDNYKKVTPINNQGEPLTASEVGL